MDLGSTIFRQTHIQFEYVWKWMKMGIYLKL
jgi:hypothetical protein